MLGWQLVHFPSACLCSAVQSMWWMQLEIHSFLRPPPLASSPSPPHAAAATATIIAQLARGHPSKAAHSLVTAQLPACSEAPPSSSSPQQPLPEILFTFTTRVHRPHLRCSALLGLDLLVHPSSCRRTSISYLSVSSPLSLPSLPLPSFLPQPNSFSVFGFTTMESHSF